MEKQKLKIDEDMPRMILADKFRKMAEDIENGQLELQSGEKVMRLMTPESMLIKIKAKQKENKEKIELELSWRESIAPTVQADETTDIITETKVSEHTESSC